MHSTLTFPSPRLVASILAAALASPALRGELIPASRLVDWTANVSTGVPGGIPSSRTRLVDVTAAPFLADRTGARDATAAIQAAINAAVAGDVVYLPAGTYLCKGAITTGYKSNITVRGAGSSTVLVAAGGGASFLQIGGGSDYTWSWPPSGNVVTAGLTKGSTTLTLADTSAFRAGQLVQVRASNNPATPVVSVFGYEGLQRQMTRVVAKTATTLTIFPPLYADLGASRVTVFCAQFQADAVGLESLRIEMAQSSAPFAVWLQQTVGCWVTDVHVRQAANYHLFLNDSLFAEVRRCFLDTLNHVGSNGAALLCNTVSACLVEDNILYRAFPLIEVNHGSSGNVFAYNFCEDSAPGVAIDSNHGPHNAFNLYEGNIAPNLQSDGYFGSASADTVFRNWLHGILNGQMAWTVSLNRFTRAYSLVGNILQRDGFTLSGDGVSLGNPNMGNSSYAGTAPPWTDGALAGAGSLTQSGSQVSVSVPMFNASHVGWFIMTPTTSALGLITAYQDPQRVTVNNSQTLTGVGYVLTPGPAGYQGLDTGVAATLVRKGNFSYYAGAIPAAEATAPDPVPASLFRASKPAWFGDLAWPPFDATRPSPAYASIPAGYRWVNGIGPAPDPTKTQPPINVRIGK